MTDTIFDQTNFNDAKIEVYITTAIVVDGNVVQDRSLKTENVDWIRSGTSVIFLVPPPEGAIVEINYITAAVAHADFALEVPFDHIDGMTSDYITDVIGGFDGAFGVYEGMRIIFARQEQYPGYILQEDGWIQNFNSWDDGSPWDDPVYGWDNYRRIPGFADNQADNNVQNQRAGIWKVTTDTRKLIRLEFVENVLLGQRVLVNYGSKYGGKILKYGPTIKFDIGETVPKYSIVSTKKDGNETIFDGGSTRFIDNISVYQVPDEGDKYLVFPRVHILT